MEQKETPNTQHMLVEGYITVYMYSLYIRASMHAGQRPLQWPFNQLMPKVFCFFFK